MMKMLLTLNDQMYKKKTKIFCLANFSERLQKQIDEENFSKKVTK